METEFGPIAVDLLRFDPENPRIPRDVDAGDDVDVLDWMLGDAGLVELMGSIATKGFFPAEPLLVTPSDDGHFWVLEGNRRLAAIKLLRDPHLAPRRKIAVLDMANAVRDWESLDPLPCAIFESRSEVLDYLGYRHITGIKQWAPAAKARYLESLYDAHAASQGDEVYRYIARLIGSKQDYVKRLLGALRLHEKVAASGVLGGREEDISFSLLTLALNYSSIVAFLGLESLDQESFFAVNERNLDRLATWMYVPDPISGRTAIGDSRNMRLLAAAVSKDEGVAALDRGEPVEEAVQATLDPNELFSRAVRTARERLLAAQAVVHRIQVTDASLSAIEETAEIISQLEALARRKQRADRASGV